MAVGVGTQGNEGLNTFTGGPAVPSPYLLLPDFAKCGPTVLVTFLI